jgi:hypothetical protein
MDPNLQTLIVTGAVGYPITYIVDFLKGWLEKGLVKPTDSNHDATIRLLAGLVGVVWFTASTALQHPLTGPSIQIAVIQGFGAGPAALGIYHTVPSSSANTAGSTTLGEIQIQNIAQRTVNYELDRHESVLHSQEHNTTVAETPPATEQAGPIIVPAQAVQA